MTGHRRVTIRVQDIVRLDPCDSSWRIVRTYLPITISTDPEQNITAAVKMVAAYDAGCTDVQCTCCTPERRVLDDVRWVIATLPFPDGSHFELREDLSYHDGELSLLPQYLAMIADWWPRS